MELGVFRRPAVAGLLKNVIEARLHTDRQMPELPRILELQNRLAGKPSLPYFLLLDPETETRIGEPTEGLQSGEDFAQFLKQAVRS
jgi:hypothetical protein